MIDHPQIQATRTIKGVAAQQLDISEGSLNWCHPKTSVQDGGIEGAGRFTSAEINKDDPVCLIGGLVVTREELEQLDYKNAGQHTLTIVDGLYLLNPNTDPKKRVAVNHSCEPNVYVEGQVLFRAMRKILVGEELTLDYATIIDEHRTIIQDCNCGSFRCRKSITGKDWMLKSVQGLYGEQFNASILKKQHAYTRSDCIKEVRQGPLKHHPIAQRVAASL